MSDINLAEIGNRQTCLYKFEPDLSKRKRSKHALVKVLEFQLRKKQLTNDNRQF